MKKAKSPIVINSDNSLWKGARLTKRDEAILEFINQFGYCQIQHIKRRFNLKGSRVYQITDKLKTMGLVWHEMVLDKRPGLVGVTKNGASFTSLPRLNKLRIANYHHHLAIINVYFELAKNYPEAKWIPERKLIQGIGQRGHIPDGILKLSADEKIAIEVELTRKEKQRLDDILEFYLTEGDYKEVWYYVAKKVRPLLEGLIHDYPFVRIKPIEEYLP